MWDEFCLCNDDADEKEGERASSDGKDAADRSGGRVQGDDGVATPVLR